MIHLSKDRFVLGGAAIVFLMLFYTVFSERGLLKARELANERDALKQTAQALEEDNLRLLTKTASLKSDMAVIEKAARNQLDLVREDEILYKFVN